MENSHMKTSRNKLSLAIMLLAGSLPATTVLAGMMDGSSQSGTKQNADHMIPACKTGLAWRVVAIMLARGRDSAA